MATWDKTTWDKTTIIVSAVVGSLGVLSVILGVAAEAQWRFPNLGLVICVGIFLMAAQITVAAVSGCYGCCKSRAIPSETKQIVGIMCAVFSWLVAVIVLALLLIGIFVGFFAGIGVLALVSTELGITSYILMRSEPKGAELLAVEVAATGPNNGPSQEQPPVVITVGQPQFSPTDQTAEEAQNKPAGGTEVINP